MTSGRVFSVFLISFVQAGGHTVPACLVYHQGQSPGSRALMPWTSGSALGPKLSLRSRANAMLPGLNATHEATMPLQLIKCTQKRQHCTELARRAGQVYRIECLNWQGVPIRSTELGTCAEWCIQHDNQSIEKGEQKVHSQLMLRSLEFSNTMLAI